VQCVEECNQKHDIYYSGEWDSCFCCECDLGKTIKVSISDWALPMLYTNDKADR